MKIANSPLGLAAILFAASLLSCASTDKAAQTTTGGDSSSVLTSKAWAALGNQNLDEAVALADTCVKLYGAEALKMQASLTQYPPNKPQEATTKYWALNDVSTILFIKGEALLKKGDSAGAKKAYKRCANDFKFGQCWDPKGWFWKPADPAKQKIVEIEFDE